MLIPYSQNLKAIGMSIKLISPITGIIEVIRNLKEIKPSIRKKVNTKNSVKPVVLVFLIIIVFVSSYSIALYRSFI